LLKNINAAGNHFKPSILRNTQLLIPVMHLITDDSRFHIQDYHGIRYAQVVDKVERDGAKIEIQDVYTITCYVMFYCFLVITPLRCMHHFAASLATATLKYTEMRLHAKHRVQIVAFIQNGQFERVATLSR